MLTVDIKILNTATKSQVFTINTEIITGMSDTFNMIFNQTEIQEGKRNIQQLGAF